MGTAREIESHKFVHPAEYDFPSSNIRYRNTKLLQLLLP